jgi:hypothetical protein
MIKMPDKMYLSQSNITIQVFVDTYSLPHYL